MGIAHLPIGHNDMGSGSVHSQPGLYRALVYETSYAVAGSLTHRQWTNGGYAVWGYPE